MMRWGQKMVVMVVALLCGAPAFASCNLEAHAPWTSAKAQGLQVNAYAVGEVCGFTAVVLTVTDAKGRTLWTLSRSARDVSIFSSDAGMRRKEVQDALAQWLKIGLAANDTRTGSLPDWPEGAEAPTKDSEFGYIVDEGLSREFYLEQRAANRPLFCTVTGMESETCIISQGQGRVTEFGGMTFPG